MTRVFIGLGTNLGDRAANLEQALALLPPEVSILRRSSVYESEPVGLAGQPLFLNAVVAGATDLMPLALLRHLKGIEARMGRQPAPRNGPRLIDLDLLFYADWVLHVDGLEVPHPRIAERSFVLAPLCEIAPDFLDPLTGETVAEMWRQRRSALSKSWVYSPSCTPDIT